MGTSKNATEAKLSPDEWLDELPAQVQNKDAESILEESNLAGRLKKQLAERILPADRFQATLSIRCIGIAGRSTPGQAVNALR